MRFAFHFYSRSNAKEMADSIYEALRSSSSDQIPYIKADLVEGEYMRGCMNFSFGFDNSVKEA